MAIMKLLKLAPILLVAACTTQNLERLDRTAPQGTSFNDSLSREYLEFARYEADKMYDWIDQDHFAAKGLRAAKGELVLPEDPKNWKIAKDKLGEIAAARVKLMSALDNGARETAPKRAAVAQARYDCWVEQLEEGWQTDHIARCRDEFFAALGDLEKAMAPPPAAVVVPVPATAPRSWLVFFDFDSAELTGGARDIVRDAAANVRDGGISQLRVVGHADKSGASDYNQRLSQRRATAVRNLLVNRGVDGTDINVRAVGESFPLVPTEDGVREPQNRRVEILVSGTSQRR